MRICGLFFRIFVKYLSKTILFKSSKQPLRPLKAILSKFFKVGEKFRSRALKFPGLISGCTINWLQRWPKDALIAVANHFFSTFDIVCEAEVKSQVIVSMGSIHDGVATSCADYFERCCVFLNSSFYFSLLCGILLS